MGIARQAMFDLIGSGTHRWDRFSPGRCVHQWVLFFDLAYCVYSAHMNAPHPVLTYFEEQTGLGPTLGAKLLGLPYITYAQYRSYKRPWKVCHERHIEVILMLEPKVRSAYIERVTHGS